MRILKFKDRRFFSKLMKLFENSSKVTFEITKSKMRISTLSQPYLYLIISEHIFEINGDIEFTIDAKDLIDHLDELEADFVVLDKSFKIVELCRGLDLIDSDLFENGNYSLLSECEGELERVLESSSYIEIPFQSPIESYYKVVNAFSTRFFISTAAVRNLLRGHVKYSNGSNLIIKKHNIDEEEQMEVSVDYLEKGYLDFPCSNDWIDRIVPVTEIIDNVIFCFSESILSIKVMFKQCPDTFMEIQVHERTSGILD